MKQQKLWRRWFGRKERIEITHETSTRLVIRTAAAAEFIRCPKCGCELPGISTVAESEWLNDSNHESSRQLVLHACKTRSDVERTVQELSPGDQ
jgi:hypothetical protein